MNIVNVQETKNLQREAETSCEEELWLRGQPPLEDYLDFMEESSLDGEFTARSTLIDEWREADDYYAKLEGTEAEAADGVEIRGLATAIRAYAKNITSGTRFLHVFGSLPTRCAMVELDRLVASRPYLALREVDRFKQSIHASMPQEALLDFCLAVDRKDVLSKVLKTGSRSFMVWSPSADFGFHNVVQLDTGELPDCNADCVPSGIIGAVLGYNFNFLSAIQHEKRLLLNSGLERAYALREIGITHAPCIVTRVTRFDELKLVASRTVVSDPNFYFAAKRPPLLRDFFDPNIRKIVPVHQTMNMVEVTIEVKERTRIRAFDNFS